MKSEQQKQQLIGLKEWCILIFLLICTIFIYRPGLSGPFVFDDYKNIVQNDSLKIVELSTETLRGTLHSVPNGVFGRPLSMFTFAVNYYWDRDLISPFPVSDTFKKTNLAIHILNGALIFIFVNLLIKFEVQAKGFDQKAKDLSLVAFAVTAAWLFHPFNLTSVLYVVQRMTSLSTLFIMLGMIVYLLGRMRLETKKPFAHQLMIGAILVFMPISFLCKEIGALLPAYVCLMELILFKRNELSTSSLRFVKYYFLILFWIPLFIGLLYTFENWNIIVGWYSKREFTLTERLLTESRVVLFYLYQTVLPSINSMGLFHDDIVVSKTLVEPISTLLSLMGISGILLISVLSRKRYPLVAFGLMFFMIGHSLESSFIPLELVHEHRNYLPSVGILLVVFYMFLYITSLHGTKKVGQLAAALFLMLLPAVTISRVADWSNPQRLWAAETMNHPNSIRSQISFADFYANGLSFDVKTKEDNYRKANAAYLKALSIDENSVYPLFGLIRLGDTYNREVSAEYIEKLRNLLMRGTLPVDVNDRLISLAICIGKDSCPIKRTQFENLMEAALRNPKLQGREKALVYSAQTFYLFNVLRDYTSALQSIKKAIELDGDIEQQMWLANIYSALQDVESAKGQIAKIRELDQYQTKARDILAMEFQLSSIKK